MTAVAGPPGSGKSTLLDHASREVADDIQVLRAVGHPAETDLPYAGLHQLLAPYEETLRTSDDPSVGALAAALAIVDGAPADRVAVARALLWFVTDLAAQRPVLVVVDDVAWWDVVSRQALIFLARRLGADPVAIWVGVRGDVSADLGAISTDVLELGPLDAAAARAVLCASHPDLSVVVADRLIAAAAGLPLALRELPAVLSPEQRQARTPLPASLPLGPTLTGLYDPRVRALDPASRLALLIAVLDELPLCRLVRVLATAGLTLADLEPAERSGLLARHADAMRPVHPTVQHAVVQNVTTRELDHAHRLLAHEVADDPARYAAHMRQVADAPDAEVVAALETAAEQAERRGAHIQAGDAWHAAATRTGATRTGAARRRSLLAQAARAYVRGGAGMPAQATLAELVASEPDETERAQWLHLQLTTALWLREISASTAEEAVGLARTLVARGGSDAEAGHRLLVVLLASALCNGEGRRGRGLVRIAREADRIPFEVALLCDCVAVQAGEPGAGRLVRSDWASRLGELGGGDTALAVGFACLALGWLDEIDRCERVCSLTYELVEQAFGAGVALSSVASMRALVDQRRGAWDRAEVEYAAAEAGAHEHDFAGPSPYMVVRHALLWATRGDADRCRRLLADVRRGRDVLTPRLAFDVAFAEGRLHLSLGEHDEAAQAYEQAAAASERGGVGAVLDTIRVPDHLEALWHLGRHDEVGDDLADLTERAARDGNIAAQALARRCHALVAQPGEVDDEFASALLLHDKSPDPFERARTQLAFGVRLRRLRRKADARRQLEAALETFIELGARPWAERARRELAACGRRIDIDRTGERGPLATLTPREFDVARAVAGGASNTEVAGDLVISRRTVEHHLAGAFRKLGVRERTALRRFFG